MDSQGIISLSRCLAVSLSRCLAVSLLALWSLTALATEAPPTDFSNRVVLTDDQGEYPLGLHLAILEDPTKALTIDQITQQGFASKFVPSTQQVPGYGFSKSAYWVRVELMRRTSREGQWMLKYDYAPMQWIDVYQVKSSGEIEHQKGGMGIPLSKRPYPHYKHVFELNIPDNSVTVLYVRVDSDGSKTIPLALYRADALAQESERETAAIAVYIGIIIALFLYNGFLFITLRESSYFYYLCFLMAFLTFAASLHGVSQFILVAENTVASLRLVPSSIGVSLPFALMFARQLLEIKRQSRLLDAIVMLGVMLGVAAGLTPWFASYHASIIFGVALAAVYSPVLLGIGINLALKGQLAARYYISAWLLLLIGIILNIARLSGFIETTALTEYAMLWGSAAECVLLAIALAARMRLMKEEKERAQTQQLETQQVLYRSKQEQLHAQQALNAAQLESLNNKQIALDTIQKYSNKLEAEVKARTSELIETQQKLVASEKMAALSVFTAGMAHEINNPANFVSVGAQNTSVQIGKLRKFVDELMADDPDPEVVDGFEQHFSRLEKSNATVTEGISRIEKVVKQLRADHPEGDVGMQPTDIAATIESAWQVFSATLKTPISLTKNLEHRPILDCAVAQIQQVFIALLSNAAHAIEDAKAERGDSYEGKITLTSAQINDHLLITISDNGAGIPAENLEKIFDPFFTTKVVGRGAGLGLSMARDVVKKHHGTLEVKSTVGEGTTFTLELGLTQPG